MHIHANAAMADVTIGPGHGGSIAAETMATVRLMREISTPFPARYVRLTVEPHKPGPRTIEAAAVPAADGTWRIVALPRPSAGIWTVRISVGTAGTTIVLDAPIVITQCSNEC